MSTTTPELSPEFAKLELSDVNTVFNEVQGFSITWNVEQQATGTTDQGGKPVYAYSGAAAQYGDLLCNASLLATDPSLFTWWEAIAAGTLTPKDGTLMLLTPEAKPTATFSIVGAVLTRLEITGQSLANPSAAGITAVLNCLSYSRLS